MITVADLIVAMLAGALYREIVEVSLEIIKVFIEWKEGRGKE